MRTGFIAGISGPVLALVMAFPAFSVVTAPEIRDGFVSLYKSLGYQVTIGSESMSGNTMTLDNLSVTTEVPDGKGKFSATYDWVKLKEVNGAVEISLAPTMAINFQSGPSSKKEVNAVAHANMPDASIVASGSIDDLTLKSSLPAMTFVLDKLMADGKQMPVDISVTGEGMRSIYNIVRAENSRPRYDGTSSLSSIAFSMNVQKPEGGKFVNVVGNIADLTSTFSTTFNAISADEFNDPMAFFKLGLDGRASLESGPFSFAVNSNAGGNTTALSTSGESGKIAFDLSKKTVGYSFSETGVKFDMASSKLPVPRVKFGYDRLAVSFRFPLVKAAKPGDFRVKAALRGLSVDESLWSMIDPGKTLPRDPISVVLGLSGKLMMLADLMDPKTGKSLNRPPFLPVSIDLDKLTVSALGAMLTGKGGVTFDFANGKSLKGFPVPVGSISLDLKGGYGLMDKLVALRLLPKDTATGIRAMLGAFSIPVGKDHIQTRIEATADGAISANGQRIQ